jgi:RNA polymerase sigma factor (sigma-70 family)
MLDIRHWLNRLQPASATDADLVHRFVCDRDEGAFAALVDRHGPLVLGVARRVVGDEHTAEDVFQATFIMLARRARSLRQAAALPAWLHRTACNLARTAARARRRRYRAEARAVGRAAGDPLDDLSSRELLAILDEELCQLPEAFRLPLMLCCLEGRSQEEAAAILGWTPGSVKGRLERGRKCLKDRLARRGLTFAIAAGAPLLLGSPSLAAALRQATLQAAIGGAPLSAEVAALAHRTLVPSLLARKWLILLVTVLGLLGGGTGLALLANSKSMPEADAPTSLLVTAAQAKAAMPPTDAAGEPLPQGAVGRLGSSRLRIGNAAFALTPDGRTIVTVSPQGVVRTFDAQNGKQLDRRQFTDRHEANPTGQAQVELSADGKTAVIRDQRMTVWDVPSGKMIFRPPTVKGQRVGHGVLSPNGRQLAVTVYRDDRQAQTLRVYDLQSGQGKELGDIEYNVYDTYFSADGKRLVLSQISARPGPRETTLAYFDVVAGKRLWVLPHKGQVFAFSPDGKTVVSATFDQGSFQVIETDPESGKPAERVLPSRLAHPNVRPLFAADNRTVVMNHFNGVAKLDVLTGDETVCFKPPRQSGRGWGPEFGAISGDGRTVLTNLGYLQRWDLATGKPFFEPPPDDGLGGPIEQMAFTHDGKEVVATSWSISSGRWEVATGKRVALTDERLGRQLINTPGGLRILRCDSYKSPYQVAVHDPVTGKLLQTVDWSTPAEFGSDGLRAYALTADGKTLLVAHSDEPGPPAKQRSFVTTCDVASGRRLTQFAVAGRLIFTNSPFSPCGRWVVLAGKVYHVATGTPLFAPAGDPDERLMVGSEDGHTLSPVWFSGDGRLLAGRLSSKKGAMVAVWELASGAVLARFPKVGHVAEVAFAPDGRTIALLDGWGVHLHDLPTGQRLAAYPAADVFCTNTDRGCGTQNLAFAPDGRTLATGHLDGTVLLWKVPAVRDDDPKEIAASARESLWDELSSDAPAKARAAVDRLVRRPATALPLLRGRFQPAPTPADPALAALIKDLDSEMFATREAATRRLRDYGTKAESTLRHELTATTSPEVRRRIEDILAAIPPPPLRLPLTGDALRGVRAIEVLERVGTPNTRQQLQAWANQTRDVHLAAEARAALGRATSSSAKDEAPQR